jgi:hypothetical protein
VEIIVLIAGGHLLAVVAHWNAARYPGRAMSLVEVGDCVWRVPFWPNADGSLWELIPPTPIAT